MKTLKIELDNKIFRLPKPDTYEDLRARLSAKFGKHEMQRRLICYRDNEGDEVVIECEADLEVAFQQGVTAEKLVLKRLPEPQVHNSNALQARDLGYLCSYFDSLTNQSTVKKVETCLKRDQLPCPNCSKCGKLSDNQKRKYCVHCEGTGAQPMTRIWNLILLLINCKIKEHMLNPLKNLPPERQVGNLKDELHEESITKISFEASANPLNTKNDVKHKDTSSGNLQISYILPSVAPANPQPKVASRINLSSIFNNTINETSFRKTTNNINKSAGVVFMDQQSNLVGLGRKISSSMGYFGQPMRQNNANSSFYTGPTLTEAIDERLFTKELLTYGLMEGECWVSNSNNVEVRLMIENVDGKNWPSGVRVKGKDCELTKDIDAPLEKRLKAHSFVGVKLTFPLRVEALGRNLSEQLCFEFAAIDSVKQIKYFSYPLKLSLNVKRHVNPKQGFTVF